MLCIYTLALRIFTLLLAAFAILSCPELSKKVIVGPVGHLVHYQVGHHRYTNSSDGLIFVKRRALDMRFLDKNAGFRRAHRRAKFTFLIFSFYLNLPKKSKLSKISFLATLVREGTIKLNV